jgi:hypothetical protein
MAAQVQRKQASGQALRIVSTGQSAFTATPYAVPPAKWDATDANAFKPCAPITMILAPQRFASSIITFSGFPKRTRPVG